MTAMRCACPKCQMALQIAQALPVRVKCPRCETVFTVAGPNGAPAASSGIRPRTAATPSGVRSATPSAAPVRLPAPELITASVRRGSHGTSLIVVSAAAVLVVVGAIVAVVLLRGGQAEQPGNPQPPSSQRDKTLLAIEQGVSYLRGQLMDDKQAYHYDTQPGSHVGVVALAGLTLLECGAAADDAAVQKAVATVRRESHRLTHTYALALSILLLDRLQEEREKPDPKDRELIQRIAVQMIAGQNVNGGWFYHCPTLSREDAQRYLADLKAGRPIPRGERGRDDNSINQFATLALWAARRHDVKTDDILLTVERRYRENQNRDGSWGYVARDDDGHLKDATTCAGLIGLAVGQVIKSEMAAKNKKAKPPVEATKDPAIAKAFEYLGRAIGKTVKKLPEAERMKRQQDAEEMLSLQERWHKADPSEKAMIGKALNKLEKPPQRLKGTYIDADAWGDLYFLWSVERVGMIYDLTMIGGRDWYAWGSEIILANQRPDGSWRDRFPGVPDTCFALLFLRRANVAKDLTDKLKNLRRTATIGLGPGQTPSTPPARKE